MKRTLFDLDHALLDGDTDFMRRTDGLNR